MTDSSANRLPTFQELEEYLASKHQFRETFLAQVASELNEELKSEEYVFEQLEDEESTDDDESTDEENSPNEIPTSSQTPYHPEVGFYVLSIPGTIDQYEDLEDEESTDEENSSDEELTDDGYITGNNEE
jgi:hypothetical protein